MNFIDEMIRDITNEKKRLDEIAFLKFLKEELDREGIELKVIHQPKHLINENLITSDVMGVQLDLSEHDKKKDEEIEKCKKAFELAGRKKDAEICKQKYEIEALSERIRELEESQEDLPIEPIKVAEYLIDRTLEVKNTFPKLQGSETSLVAMHDVSELRQIAEHLLVYCDYAEDE